MIFFIFSHEAFRQRLEGGQDLCSRQKRERGERTEETAVPDLRRVSCFAFSVAIRFEFAPA